jgi:hypothetical protein
MLHRIRLGLQDGNGGMLGGEVEVDETFIGGKARNMHKSKREAKITGRGPEGKEIVFGMVARREGCRRSRIRPHQEGTSADH